MNKFIDFSNLGKVDNIFENMPQIEKKITSDSCSTQKTKSKNDLSENLEGEGCPNRKVSHEY